jgi:hypothetical protein
MELKSGEQTDDCLGYRFLICHRLNYSALLAPSCSKEKLRARQYGHLARAPFPELRHPKPPRWPSATPEMIRLEEPAEPRYALRLPS